MPLFLPKDDENTENNLHESQADPEALDISEEEEKMLRLGENEEDGFLPQEDSYINDELEDDEIYDEPFSDEDSLETTSESLEFETEPLENEDYEDSPALENPDAEQEYDHMEPLGEDNIDPEYHEGEEGDAPYWSEDTTEEDFYSEPTMDYVAYPSGNNIFDDNDNFSDITSDYTMSEPIQEKKSALSKKAWAAICTLALAITTVGGLLIYNTASNQNNSNDTTATGEDFSIESLLNSQNAPSNSNDPDAPSISNDPNNPNANLSREEATARIQELEGQLTAATSAINDANNKNQELQSENEQLKSQSGDSRTVTRTKTDTRTVTRTRTDTRTRTNTRTVTAPARTITPRARTVTAPPRTVTAPARTVTRPVTITNTRRVTATQRVPGPRTTITTTVIQRQ